jgi:outer membrane protein
MMPTSLAHAENIGSIPTIRRWVEDPLSTVPARLNEGAWLALGDIKPDCLQPDVPRQPVSLIMAVDYSLCRSPEIAGTWAAIKAQSAALGQSRAAYLPSLSVTVNRQRTQSKYADSELISTTAKGVSISVGFNWRLFDFGTRAATEESANDLLLAAMADHDATLQQVLATTIQAYFDTQTAQAAWTASKHNMVTAMETLNSAKRREQMGAVSRGDTLQATTAYAKLVLEHSRAGGSFRKSLATLMFNMGLSSGDPVTLVDESDYVPAPGVLDDPMEALVGSLEQYLETARRSHPAIRAAKAQWEAAAAVVRATRGEGLPTVDLAVNTFKNGYPGQGLSASASRVNTVGIAISFPLFDGYAHSYKVKEMSARQDQKDAVLTEVERHILSDIVRTHADVTAALGNLKASKQLSEAAMEALLSAKRKYERGAADIQEILQTQNAVADARQERVRCLSELRSARLRLLTSTGILGLRQMHDER